QRWDGQFTTQEGQINVIEKIAQNERDIFYNDIDTLISDKSRFSLDNLLNYSPSTWLSKRNPVIVKFIETLTSNDQYEETKTKLFKRAIAIDAIYGSRHLKYVSAIGLATSAIKYSLARSRTLIDVDNHIISSGSYVRFINWLEN